MLEAGEAQRTNAIKQGFVEPSFSLGNRLETQKPTGATANASPQELARQEQERRRNEKK
jgi:hypothetical protein